MIRRLLSRLRLRWAHRGNTVTEYPTLSPADVLVLRELVESAAVPAGWCEFCGTRGRCSVCGSEHIK